MGIAFDIEDRMFDADKFNSIIEESFIDTTVMERSIINGDLDIFDESVSFKIKIVPLIFKSADKMNPAELQATMEKMIDKCKDKKDIDFLKKDFVTAATQLTATKQLIADYKKGKDVKINKNAKKAIDNGDITPASLDKYIKWLKGGAIKKLNAKAKEINK